MSSLSGDSCRRAANSGLASLATTAQPPVAPDLFSVGSSGVVELARRAQDDPRAKISFMHDLRQSRLSWYKQFIDPAVASLRVVTLDKPEPLDVGS